MLSQGITLPLAIEVLKREFVATARRDFQLENKSITDSRINLLTGVHRKDIKRLRELADVDATPPPKHSFGAQLFARWTTEKPWIDAQGTPRPLQRLATQNTALSFEGLANSISRDIRPRSLLDEWVRLKIVSINKADEVALNTTSFIPRTGLEDIFFNFGLNLGEHAETACDNAIGDATPRFDRSIHHEGLSAEQLEYLSKRASELGTRLLQTLHTEAIALKQSSAAKPLHKQRFTYGVYWHDNQNKRQ